jgi:hypothetical protein
VVGTGWSWLRIGTCGGYLLAMWRTLGFQKYGEFLDYLQISFSRRTLLHGVSKYFQSGLRIYWRRHNPALRTLVLGMQTTNHYICFLINWRSLLSSDSSAIPSSIFTWLGCFRGAEKGAFIIVTVRRPCLSNTAVWAAKLPAWVVAVMIHFHCSLFPVLRNRRQNT